MTFQVFHDLWNPVQYCTYRGGLHIAGVVSLESRTSWGELLIVPSSMILSEKGLHKVQFFT